MARSKKTLDLVSDSDGAFNDSGDYVEGDDENLTDIEGSEYYGISRSTFWRHVRRGTLPPPSYILPRTPRWRRGDLRKHRDRNRRLPQHHAEMQRRALLGLQRNATKE
jgi:predicted DNA-binding transcriptional regulator AlpA